MDYQRLNSLTKMDVFLLPWIDDTLDSLAQSSISLPLTLLQATGKSRWILTHRKRQLLPLLQACLSFE